MMRTLTNSPSTFIIQKKLRKACKTAQLIQNLSAPKTASLQKFALAYASQLREHSSPNFLHGTRYMVHLKNLSAPKTASIQKFALLLLRNSASIARQISYMVHLPGPSQNLSAPKTASLQKFALAYASQLREQSSPNFLHGTRYMVHGT